MENEEIGMELCGDDILFEEEAELLESRQLILVEIIIRILQHLRERNTAVRRAIWVRQFWERGAENPYYVTLMTHLRAEGDEFFRNFAHVSEDQFNFLCVKVRSIVEKQDTPMRVAISVEERVALTLKHLASGDNYNSLSQVFRISRASIVETFPEVCTALYETLTPEYLQVSIFLYLI